MTCSLPSWLQYPEEKFFGDAAGLLNWYRGFYLQWSRELVFPVCGIVVSLFGCDFLFIFVCSIGEVCANCQSECVSRGTLNLHTKFNCTKLGTKLYKYSCPNTQLDWGRETALHWVNQSTLLQIPLLQAADSYFPYILNNMIGYKIISLKHSLFPPPASFLFESKSWNIYMFFFCLCASPFHSLNVLGKI